MSILNFDPKEKEKHQERSQTIEHSFGTIKAVWGLPAILMPDTGADECGTVVRIFGIQLTAGGQHFC